MPTQPVVTIDAPPPDNHRTAAAATLALQLRRELMNLADCEPSNQTSLSHLVHYLDPHQQPAEPAMPVLAAAAWSPGEPANRYIPIGSQDVKRLQRIAHLLSSLSGELTLWLASLPKETAEVEL